MIDLKKLDNLLTCSYEATSIEGSVSYLRDCLYEQLQINKQLLKEIEFLKNKSNFDLRTITDDPHQSK